MALFSIIFNTGAKSHSGLFVGRAACPSSRLHILTGWQPVPREKGDFLQVCYLALITV